MINKYNIEEQYQLYLQRVKLDESKMSFTQKRETKQAFYAGCGQMLFLMCDNVTEHDEDKAVDHLDDMINQVSVFFLQPLN